MVPLPEWVDLPQRKSPRHPSHDYGTPGAYALVVCTHSRVPLLGKLHEAQMALNGIGRMVKKAIGGSADRYPGIGLDVHCVMHDHVHLIAWVKPPGKGVPHITIPQYMSRLKSFTATQYRRFRQQYPRLPEKLWERSYWDRYLRDDRELELFRTYILQNPLALQLERDFKLRG